jgi:hypothetical protein
MMEEIMARAHMGYTMRIVNINAPAAYLLALIGGQFLIHFGLAHVRAWLAWYRNALP